MFVQVEFGPSGLPWPPQAGAKRQTSARPGPPTHAFTVDEFCDAHRISKARYYELKLEGLAPDEMIVGRRRIISHEAADVPSGFDLSPPTRESP